ncbi:type II toxin-antitoxin system PemK/MazF family toxin [Flavobacterium sp. CS20]|jgi:mRNA interferase MazF|uniref:type II toxin-antitoxin system PemK/MazF family toxin n=1 Tax=Flavobacterium sp. CS20 TaxID=2775246 RepID=UPI001B3A4114|nr:type II toxin-antitoxin system PemK/MazF family toxin [Flavobacterium sp. CS20]QTY26232.1 type II toxin-antitoxin system PemK/MazF family toxin [Flavobacterium sp. CS20]
MEIKQFEIWIADLNPRIGTEPGKKRPVLIIQSNLLNKLKHPSTLICPLTTNVKLNVDILRVHIGKDIVNLKKPSDIMIDQIRAIDNNRLVEKIGQLPKKQANKVKANLEIIFDLSF